MAVPADGGYWRLQTLGRPALFNGEGQEVRLPTRHVFLVLATMAFEPKTNWRRAALAETIWPGSEAARARGSLRTALNGLRKCLPADAIQTDGELVGLRPNWLVSSTESPDGPGVPGEFMPGFDIDWVIEHRLKVKSRQVSAAIAQASAAWSENDRELALNSIERACAIDPLDQVAVQVRVSYLRAMGKLGAAAAVTEGYELKIRRELGGDGSDKIEKSGAESHPLAAAAEWLLEREPAEAHAMLAATQQRWLSVPLQRAVDVHRRVLAATPPDTPNRKAVEAHLIFLQSLGGQPGQTLAKGGAVYTRALESGDLASAIRVSAGLAFAQLSVGEFQLALKLARTHLDLANSGRDHALRGVANYNLGVIQVHCLESEPGFQRLRSSAQYAAEAGQETGVAMANVSLTPWLVRQGDFKRLEEGISFAERTFRRDGNARMEPWAALSRALFLEATGSLESARATVLGMRPKAVDHESYDYSVAVQAEDLLMRLNGKLGEWDASARAWAAGRLLRQVQNVVSSRFERLESRETRLELMERFGQEGLLNVYRKTMESHTQGSVT